MNVTFTSDYVLKEGSACELNVKLIKMAKKKTFLQDRFFMSWEYLYLTAKETHIFNIHFIPETLIKFYPK